MNEGSVLSGMNDYPPKVYNVGESFIEFPGCHHTVGENSSKTAPARLTAVFVVDSKVIENGFAGLVVLDEECINRRECNCTTLVPPVTRVFV